MYKAKKYIRNIHVPRGIDVIDVNLEFDYSGLTFVPWGRDNLQPNNILNAISNSPTASGASSANSNFVKGEGFSENGDLIVNRHGHTLNDILEFCTNQKSIFGDFALHFNFNLLGQINEIQMIKMHMLRVGSGLSTVIIQPWDLYPFNVYGNTEFPIYNQSKLSSQIRELKGFQNFKGAILYKPANMDLYPSMFAHSSLPSFELEKDMQITSLAFAKNGFKGSGILKLPETSNPEQDKKDRIKIERLQDPGNAGSIITMNMPTNAEGDTQTSNMFESFTIPNVDKQFVNQGKAAKDFILNSYNVPEALLSNMEKGVFSQSDLSDAFFYFNGKTAGDREKVERIFNGFMKNTVWGINDLTIEPLALSKFIKPEEPNPELKSDNVIRAKIKKLFKFK